MGFHKRYIDDDQVINIYRTSGCQAVIDWYTKGVDAVILSGPLSSTVHTLLNILEHDHERGWNRISEEIMKASLEKGFKN
jgi:hypothetical protein|tara:strand:+ start:1259 stop:1498 length:240 start_codon:yes stop_codon:yes gene_type:complete